MTSAIRSVGPTQTTAPATRASAPARTASAQTAQVSGGWGYDYYRPYNPVYPTPYPQQCYPQPYNPVYPTPYCPQPSYGPVYPTPYPQPYYPQPYAPVYPTPYYPPVTGPGQVLGSVIGSIVDVFSAFGDD